MHLLTAARLLGGDRVSVSWHRGERASGHDLEMSHIESVQRMRSELQGRCNSWHKSAKGKRWEEGSSQKPLGVWRGSSLSLASEV